MEHMRMVLTPHDSDAGTSGFHGSLPGREEAERVRTFHTSFPQYEKTPLVPLDRLAGALGVRKIFVKDESARFGLNAFKVLGGSYAIGLAVAELLGVPPEKLTYEKLTSPEVRQKTASLTFATATDGNHGRGVAWTARTLGCKAKVWLPKGSAKERLDNILATGADAEITGLGYDDTVRLASGQAEKNGWIFIQDTALDGYETVPARIMKGYTTMTAEIFDQLDGLVPTHLFVQAGVGSLAGAAVGYFASAYGAKRPKMFVVEPENADCHYRTALAADGKTHAFEGEMSTIMAGLACGEPNPLSWRILDAYADGFLTIPDPAAEIGMRMLAHPLSGDRPIVSGESGAAGFAAFFAAMRGIGAEIRSPGGGIAADGRTAAEALGLGPDSVVLVISTEGDTDHENWRKITEKGAAAL